MLVHGAWADASGYDAVVENLQKRNRDRSRGNQPGQRGRLPNLETRKAPGGVTDIYIAPKAFHKVFCADLSAKRLAVMAATQRPLAANAFVEPSSAPAVNASHVPMISRPGPTTKLIVEAAKATS